MAHFGATPRRLHQQLGPQKVNLRQRNVRQGRSGLQRGIARCVAHVGYAHPVSLARQRRQGKIAGLIGYRADAERWHIDVSPWQHFARGTVLDEAAQRSASRLGPVQKDVLPPPYALSRQRMAGKQACEGLPGGVPQIGARGAPVCHLSLRKHDIQALRARKLEEGGAKRRRLQLQANRLPARDTRR